jgi:hypothetical protein
MCRKAVEGGEMTGFKHGRMRAHDEDLAPTGTGTNCQSTEFFTADLSALAPPSDDTVPWNSFSKLTLFLGLPSLLEVTNDSASICRNARAARTARADLESCGREVANDDTKRSRQAFRRMPSCVSAVTPSSSPFSSTIFPFTTLRIVIPVNRIFRPVSAGSDP